MLSIYVNMSRERQHIFRVEDDTCDTYLMYGISVVFGHSTALEKIHVYVPITLVFLMFTPRRF